MSKRERNPDWSLVGELSREAERFYTQAKRLEQFYVDYAHQLIAIADEVMRDEGVRDA